MRIACITVGDPRRKTGGYLYHEKVFHGLRAAGVQVNEIIASDAPQTNQQAAAARFGGQFTAQAYDVVLVDALARVVCGRWIGPWRISRPVIVLVHQLPSVAESERKHITLAEAEEAPLLRADRLVAVSQHGYDILVARGVPAERIEIISPGYDRFPLPPSTAFNRSAGDQQLHALCVAQWIPRKGITTLVRAWQEAAMPNATLDLIGETDADAQYTAEVYAAIASSPASIVVHGAVPDSTLRQAYADADLFVLPSRFEGYGMVYAEALAHGLPIVASDVGPVPSLVGAAGLVVPADDVVALAAALKHVLQDKQLRERLATAARARVATLPTWDDTINRFRQLLTDAAARRSM